MRIGYLMQNGVPDLNKVSGPQLHVIAVINGQRKIGNEVRSVVKGNGKITWSDDNLTWHQSVQGLTNKKWFRLIESAVRRVQYELKLPYLSLFDSIHFANAIYHQMQGFDILYERHGYMGFGGILAAKWLNIPLVLELNGNIIKEIDERGLDISPLQRKIGRWITIQTFRAADRIVVVSEALKQTLVSDYHIQPETISVVLNGVDIEVFEKRVDRFSILKKYNLRDVPTIAFIGSFDPWHGTDLLVSSYYEVQKKHPDSQLILIGDGELREHSERKTRQLGLEEKIIFLGRLPQDQVAELLSVAKIAVAPYPYKECDIVGTPLKLLDYMASGRAIIASTAPIHEIIEDGITGLRVPPAQVMELAEGITTLLEDDELSTTLGRNAADRVRVHSWDNVNLELNDIFLEQVKKNHLYGFN